MISPETRLIQKIHRQLDKNIDDKNERIVFRQKMNMMPGGISGIPDYYYEAFPEQMWVEYKYIPDWAKKRSIPVNKITTHQRNWLKRSVSNGRTCAVIIGDEAGQCVILKNEFIFSPPPLVGILLNSPNETANFILDHVSTKLRENNRNDKIRTPSTTSNK